MSAHDFIPRADVKFNVWQENLMLLVAPNITNWGIAAADFTNLKALQAAWENAFDKASNKQNRSAADVRAKNDARGVYEKSLRQFVAQWLSANVLIEDSDRSRMGITVKLATRIPVAIPETFPAGRIDISIHQQHRIHFVDSTTNAKAKPKGVLGCEIWMKAGGESPKDESEFVYHGIGTHSPHVVSFLVSELGQTVYYRMRWINKRGKAGPWSSIISAIVGG